MVCVFVLSSMEGVVCMAGRDLFVVVMFMRVIMRSALVYWGFGRSMGRLEIGGGGLD